MDTFDNFLSNNIKNDQINFEPDYSRMNHLHSLVNQNSTKSFVKQNSVFSFLSDFFSPRFVLAKVAFISILLVAIIGNKENSKRNNFTFQSDSTITHKNSYDTLNGYNNQFSDSLYY